MLVIFSRIHFNLGEKVFLLLRYCSRDFRYSKNKGFGQFFHSEAHMALNRAVKQFKFTEFCRGRLSLSNESNILSLCAILAEQLCTDRDGSLTGYPITYSKCCEKKGYILYNNWHTERQSDNVNNIVLKFAKSIILNKDESYVVHE
jgi:hypothetical protein